MGIDGTSGFQRGKADPDWMCSRDKAGLGSRLGLGLSMENKRSIHAVRDVVATMLSKS